MTTAPSRAGQPPSITLARRLWLSAELRQLPIAPASESPMRNWRLLSSPHETGTAFDAGRPASKIWWLAQVAATPEREFAVSGVDGCLVPCVCLCLVYVSCYLPWAAHIQMQVGTEPSRIGVALPRGTVWLVGLLSVVEGGAMLTFPLTRRSCCAPTRRCWTRPRPRLWIAPAKMNGG